MNTTVDIEQAQIHYEQGLEHLKLGNMEGVLESFRQALILQPDFAEVHFFHKNYIGNFEAAIADYRKIIELDPNRVEPYILRVAGLAICAGTKKTIAYPWISRDVDCLLYNNIINNNEKYVYNTN